MNSDMSTWEYADMEEQRELAVIAQRQRREQQRILHMNRDEYRQYMSECAAERLEKQEAA